MDRASNSSILVGCWQTKLYEKFEILVLVTMNMHCLLEWDTLQTGELVPMRKLLLPSSGEKTAL